MTWIKPNNKHIFFFDTFWCDGSLGLDIAESLCIIVSSCFPLKGEIMLSHVAVLHTAFCIQQHFTAVLKVISTSTQFASN